jgi:pimeloyl-ACP methyl ester carboxylesterase
MSVLRFVLVFFISLFFAHPASAQGQERGQKVVLLHGIAKTGSSMGSVEALLKKEGYETLNITYPSQKKNIDDIAAYLREKHLNDVFWEKADKVHIVTHSMGGLVARRYLDTYKKDIPEGKMGRVVMLAPPNGGSEVADTIHNLSLYKWFYGPAGEELTSAVQSKNESAVYYDLGIIAGTKEWPYFVAIFIVPGKSDGRVSVEKTKLDGMADHVSVSATHTFIMNKEDVHKQILCFLKNAAFEHEE